MAAIDWPLNPNPGDIYTQNGKTWQWNGNAWDAFGGSSQGPTGPTGATGPYGTDGSNSARWRYEGDISQGLPPNGDYYTDNTSLASVTQFLLPKTDFNAINELSWFQAARAVITSPTPPTFYLKVTEVGNSSVTAIYTVTNLGFTLGGNFWTFTVSLLTGAGTFTPTNQYAFSWVYNGVNGATGATGPVGATGPTGATGEKKIDAFYAYDMSNDVVGFVWNSTTMGTTAGITYVNGRWKVLSFGGAGTTISGAVTNTTLPSFYVSGTSIKVTLVTAAISSNTTGNIKFFVGLAKPTAGGSLGVDADTQWQSFTYAANGEAITTTTLTFSTNVANLGPGKNIGILVYRNSGDVDDTSTGTAYLNTFSVEIA